MARGADHRTAGQGRRAASQRETRRSGYRVVAKKKARVRLVDTTFRDAQQSLLGGYLRTDEIVPIAAKMDRVGFAAMEAFGGATFETQLRIREDPWDFLRKLNKATPNTPIQALIRGQNLVARRNFADDAVELFIKHAARAGVDVFRIFDPLNDLRNMEASIATALKDMVKVPIDVHSHCSSGMAPMAYMAAVEAGAEILDVAISPLAWGASQPAAESVVAALEGGEFDTGLDLEKMWDVQHDVEELKRRHIEHLSPVADRVDASILRYHMPGFMLEDIYRQLDASHATDRLSEVLE